MSKLIEQLLSANKDWISETEKTNPSLFEEMARGQQPPFLWIGCSDSRVSPGLITNTHPGTIFVHRNIANLVVENDQNMLSAVYYAVTTLEVKHIIVCGHYGCGGVKAAMSNDSFGLLDEWLAPLKDLNQKHKAELNLIESESKKWNKLVELNVRSQVQNLAGLSFIKDKWQAGRYPQIHGFVFDISNGKLKNLGVSIPSVND